MAVAQAALVREMSPSHGTTAMAAGEKAARAKRSAPEAVEASREMDLTMKNRKPRMGLLYQRLLIWASRRRGSARRIYHRPESRRLGQRTRRRSARRAPYRSRR